MVQAFRDTLGALREHGETTVLLSSHILSEVEATCDRIGLIRGGRMVATGTIDDLKRSASRRVTVDFSMPVNGSMRWPAGVTVTPEGPRRLVLNVTGPLGPVVQALTVLPVHDMQVEEFKLEDFVARYYEEH
jgi:ABC-2 type transport system ATP-binding protein